LDTFFARRASKAQYKPSNCLGAAVSTADPNIDTQKTSKVLPMPLN
jgi:hypothetical protein